MNAFAGLALRQLPANLQSLENVVAHMSVFGALLEYVALEGCSAKATLLPREWCRFINAVLPTGLRRWCPCLWSSYAQLVLMRRFQGVELLCVRPPSLEPGSSSGAATPAVPSTFGYQALAQATRERSATFVAARLAAELAADATACAQAAQLFFFWIWPQAMTNTWCTATVTMSPWGSVMRQPIYGLGLLFWKHLVCILSTLFRFKGMQN